MFVVALLVVVVLVFAFPEQAKRVKDKALDVVAKVRAKIDL